MSDHENADAFQLSQGAPLVDVNVEAGNAFELVERAAGNAEAASGNHRDPVFIAGEQGSEHERCLVADAAGGVFVDLRRRTLRIFEDAPAFHHRGGQMLGLHRGHAAEKHRHCPRAHLVVGDFAQGKAFDQELDFFLREFLAFALFFNERGDVHERFHS